MRLCCPLTPILTADQMKACDSYTIHTLEVPSRTLMERAAAKAAAYLLARPDLFPSGPVVLLCGGGNNGGDGLAMARFLTDGSVGEKRKVTVIYTGKYTEAGDPDESRMSEECRRQYVLARAGMVTILPPSALGEVLADAAVVVDAVFGIGLDRLITGEIASLLTVVAESGLPVLAVDIPSGVNADTGAVMGVALPAVATVTMQALKAGLVLYPGADLCGEIAIADLGIDLTPAEQPFARLADEALLRRVLPPRKRRSHKGTYGLVSLLCGSEGMSGAAVLATRGALRSGAGLARVLTPDCNRVVMQISAPEAIVAAYAFDQDIERQTDASAIVAGCGLGTADGSLRALRRVLSTRPKGGMIPVVLDADGLNLLAGDLTLWDTTLLSAPDRQVVVTPHPAEMSRLCGESVPDILADPVGVAVEYAREKGVTVVLKDAHTVIASPKGEVFICVAGNAGMARGGSGDVLAGVIGSLLAQNRGRIGTELTVTEIAAAGVYLHALAGDLAAIDLSEHGMLPSDLIERIPMVCKGFSYSRTYITIASDYD